jgi:hypothetical protein
MHGEQSLLQCCRRQWNITRLLAWKMYGRYMGVPPVCQMLGRSVDFSAPMYPLISMNWLTLLFADNDGFMYQCPTNSSNWCCYSTVLNNTCDCDTRAHILQLGPPGGVVKAPQIQAMAPLGWMPTSTSTNVTSRKNSWNIGETIGVVIGYKFKKSGIEDSMTVVLAILRWPRIWQTGRTLEMRLALGEVSS